MAGNEKIDCSKCADSLSQQTVVQDDYEFLISAVVDAAWPLLFLILVFILFPQIKKVLDAIVSYFGKVATVQIGGVTMTVTQFEEAELEKAIIELEILKSMITTAGADKKIDPPETEILTKYVTKPQRLEGYLSYVSERGKQEIFSESLVIAGADGKIDDEEYELFVRRGSKLGIELEEINSTIQEYCVEHEISPPPGGYRT
ncbi:MAG: hypothetical protein DBP02_15900 [gamma proteobacterium symbiont of Ctena orbiculata]|nr:MAG: hypothetical protein DBP02_15900 [gamma proteobacterium symbiont of Ctena orbiculata]